MSTPFDESLMRSGESVAAYTQRLDAEARTIPRREAALAALTAELEHARVCAAQLARLEVAARAAVSPTSTERKTLDGPSAPALILAYLAQHGPSAAVAVAAGTALKSKTASAALSQMKKAGQVTYESGLYGLPAAPEVPPRGAPTPESRIIEALTAARRPMTEAGLLSACGADMTPPSLRAALRSLTDEGRVGEVERGKWQAS